MAAMRKGARLRSLEGAGIAHWVRSYKNASL